MIKPHSTARELAVRVLYQVFENRAYANLELDKALFSCTLNELDRKLATELVYGTVKYKDHLDYILNVYLKKPIYKADPWTRQILRVSIYQMVFLDRIPPHAIVNEAVMLAKTFTKKNKQQDKFINGVLRSYLREPDKIKWPNKKKNYAKWLAVYYSFPQWIIEEWLKQFGKADTESLCRWFNKTPDLQARVNTLKTDSTTLMQSLKRKNILAKMDQRVPEAIRLYDSGSLRDLPQFVNGEFILQDTSSMLVAHALDVHEGDNVLDACAAPGGKTTHIAQLMNDSGQIIACDIHEHRVALIEENKKRLGISCIHTRIQDATDFPDDFKNNFDVVLVDAPCSGLGVLNRRADARWQKRRSDINDLVSLQEAILTSAANTVKIGGHLVYSTCTTTEEENEKQCQKFLVQHPNFIPSTLPEIFKPYQKSEENHEVRIIPTVDDMDGFYIAKFERRS